MVSCNFLLCNKKDLFLNLIKLFFYFVIPSGKSLILMNSIWQFFGKCDNENLKWKIRQFCAWSLTFHEFFMTWFCWRITWEVSVKHKHHRIFVTSALNNFPPEILSLFQFSHSSHSSSVHENGFIFCCKLLDKSIIEIFHEQSKVFFLKLVTWETLWRTRTKSREVNWYEDSSSKMSFKLRFN